MAIIWALGVDWFVHVSAGPVSLSGWLTLATFGYTILLAPSLIPSWLDAFRLQTSGERLPPFALVLFLLFALVRLARTPINEGVQNVAVYGSFILIIAFISTQMSEQGIQTGLRWLKFAAYAASGVYAISLFGKLDIYGDRSYALIALIFLAVLVPAKGSLIERVFPCVVFALIVLSLSRTATMVAAGMLPFLSLRVHRKSRSFVAFLLSTIIVLLVGSLVLLFPPLRDRFLTGDAAVNVGGVAVNSSGRTELWAVTINSALTSPIWGHGPGSAEALIAATFPDIGHPHSEYLRLFHDFGILGVGLWISGLLGLLAKLTRRAMKFDRPIDWSGLLVTWAIVLTSITDNVIVYPFVMVPAAVVIGLALAVDPAVRGEEICSPIAGIQARECTAFEP